MRVANFCCNLKDYHPPSWAEVVDCSPEQLHESMSDINVVVWNNNVQFREEYLQKLPGMDLFINWGASDANLPERHHFADSGVKLKAVDSYSTTAVAQFILSQILYHEQIQPVANGEMGRELYGKTVGIVGLGKIGFVTAQMLQGHHMKIAYTCASGDKHIPNMKYMDSAKEMLKQADYVIVTAKSNEQVLTVEDFERSNYDLFLLNVSNTKSFNPDLGTEMLHSGRIRKFVTDHEDRGIKTPEGVHYTPHVAYKTVESSALKRKFLDFYLHKYHNALLPEHEQPRAFVMRHGETQWNKEGRIQGRGNSPLTLRGANQMRAVVALLEDRDIRRIVHSPLGRVQQSAKILSRLTRGNRSVPIESLVEMDFGFFQGEERDVLHTEYSNYFDYRERNKVYTPFPNGESYFDVYQRLLPSVLQEGKTTGNIVVMGHESTNRVIRGILTERPLADIVDERQPAENIIEINLGTNEEIRHILLNVRGKRWTSEVIKPRV